MSRYAPAGVHYSFGPGPISPAVKWIILANVGMFLLTFVFPAIAVYLGLSPAAVLQQLWIWQVVTYMFLHVDMFHILFNMLGIWMFGVELERMWGTRNFLRYYAVTGGGAALTTVVASLLPFAVTAPIYYSLTMGASGALYGLLLAFATYYPNRPILMFLLFPIPAKYFVLIIGAISFLSSVGGGRDGVAHAAHLGGLLFGYLYLHRGRGGLSAEIKYRYLKWKMNRMRRRFDVYSGGRSDWDRNVH
ncbi:MAG TPA: rhomboid family intramembrane serine protease [Vicinamibacterales bacterium]|nr:rhomboid family intramembrane serine protease [Vicinamibacterales bacterium]